MEAIVKRWGNSLGIRIPNLIVRELSLKDGSFVDIKDKKGEIIIKPKENTKLAEILSKMSLPAASAQTSLRRGIL